MILGLDPTGMTLLVLTLLLSTLTFSGPRTTVLEGSVHLVLFLVYIVFSDLASNSRQGRVSRASAPRIARVRCFLKRV